MSSLSLWRTGARAALATVACFVTGIALTVSSGVQVLIPELDSATCWRLLRRCSA